MIIQENPIYDGHSTRVLQFYYLHHIKLSAMQHLCQIYIILTEC